MGITILGAILGKSAHETGGLGWAFLFHAAMDVGTLSVVMTG